MRVAFRRYPGWARVLGVAMALAWMAAVPVAAQEWPAVGGAEAWDSERAFVEMERLRAEIGVLRGLAGAQAALLAWNRERAEGGAAPAVLASGLCAEPVLAAWCRALPATFGESAGVNQGTEEREQ